MKKLNNEYKKLGLIYENRIINQNESGIVDQIEQLKSKYPKLENELNILLQKAFNLVDFVKKIDSDELFMRLNNVKDNRMLSPGQQQVKQELDTTFQHIMTELITSDF